jgi:GDP-L-fucose synthase
MAGIVLLTGGSGFFGRRIAEALRAKGYEVIAPGRPRFDLMDRASVDRAIAVSRPDIVVHSAAYYGGLGICVAEPEEVFYRNVIMSANILDAAARGGVKRFMGIGSACAYPAGLAGDMAEDQLWAGPLHSSVESYGFTKKLQQVGMNAYGKKFGMLCQFPLVTNLYGEFDVFGEYRSHVVAALIKRFADVVKSGGRRVVCWGSGWPLREFIYVGDAAEAVARLLESGFPDPVNVGTGIGTTIRELADLVARYTGFTGETVWDASKPDGVGRKVLDVSRMKRVLNWEAPTSLEEGLKKTIEWYLSDKDAADARP